MFRLMRILGRGASLTLRVLAFSLLLYCSTGCSTKEKLIEKKVDKVYVLSEDEYEFRKTINKPGVAWFNLDVPRTILDNENFGEMKAIRLKYSVCIFRDVLGGCFPNGSSTPFNVKHDFNEINGAYTYFKVRIGGVDRIDYVFKDFIPFGKSEDLKELRDATNGSLRLFSEINSNYEFLDIVVSNAEVNSILSFDYYYVIMAYEVMKVEVIYIDYYDLEMKPVRMYYFQDVYVRTDDAFGIFMAILTWPFKLLGSFFSSIFGSEIGKMLAFIVIVIGGLILLWFIGIFKRAFFR